MPFSNSKTNFRFTPKDFRSCTGNQVDEQYLHSRFKDLKIAIENDRIFEREFKDFKGYVAHPFNRGSIKFKDYMWLGFAHNQFKKPRDEVQFQVSIVKNQPLRIELFIDKSSIKTRRQAKQKIKHNKSIYLNLVHQLTDYDIGYSNPYKDDNHYFDCKDLNSVDFAQILTKIDLGGFHFFIGRDISKNETRKFGNQIVTQILLTWIQLRPMYDFLVFDKFYLGPKTASTSISTTEDIITNLARQFPLKNIDLNETEENAKNRENKQITYEQNWEAQEKANSSHRKTVKLLSDYIRIRGVDPKQSVIDVYVEKNDFIFLFEIKSIHTDNFINQTRTALGQLLGYEYFQVKSKPENQSKKVIRGITYTKKPTEEIINFLNAYGFSAFWVIDGNLTGNSASIKLLDDFLSGNLTNSNVIN